MSSKLLLLVLAAALSGYPFRFPKDHFDHPEFSTEWWYYTGNLHSSDGHRYGYELTFFRQANPAAQTSTSSWNANQIYLAHLALSDLDSQKFEHYERLHRAGPGLAGAVLDQRRYWNGNWQVKWISDNGHQHLQAVSPEFTLKLDLEPAKPFVIHGIDGVSQKGPQKGEASHYISFTRLTSKGILTRREKEIAVTGSSWMDHEFFTQTQDPDLQGWDWFAIQLDNNEELMLYHLRLRDGKISPYSSGTFVDAQGQAQHLANKDFTLKPGSYWKNYPLAWTLEIPSLDIKLSQTTRLPQQELYTPDSLLPTYWEGAVDYQGTAHGKAAKGVGYLEMTGYIKAQPVFSNIPTAP